MYNYIWDKQTRGYTLTTQTGKFVASELRPVYAEELKILGFDQHFKFDPRERDPYMWAKNNVYIYDGVEVAKLHKTQLGKPIECEYLVENLELKPVNLKEMIETNESIMSSLVVNTKRRIKEMYESYRSHCDIVYIAFSGGKDSVVLLDLCNEVLPSTVPVIFSDTTMELPGTYAMWDLIQTKYPDRKFLRYSTVEGAKVNWEKFGPPSRTLDWCCAVHKSAPAILALKQQMGLPSVKALAFLGIRGEESLRRDAYDGDVGVGVKNASQINAMPIESWGAHELFLYYFKHELPLHEAYRLGVPRVGCAMCPKASDKYAWFVDKAYPHLLDEYKSLITNTSTKNFGSQEDADEYIASSGWQARRNGLEIVGRLSPLAENIKGDVGEWFNLDLPYRSFLEWLKTFASVLVDGNELKLTSRCDKEQGKYQIVLDKNGEIIKSIHCQFHYSTLAQRKKMISRLKKVITKSIACVGCRACEADCAFGALSISSKGVFVDATKCTHCLKCQNIDYGCWRYKSMMVPNSSDSPLKSIANYQNFGLREGWLAIYAEEREQFPQTTALGKPMIDSARIWFKQALLVSNPRTFTPSKLLNMVNSFGADDDVLWSLIWIALVNNAPLLKWFSVNAKFDTKVTVEELNEDMGDIVSSATKRGGLQALCNFFKSTPIGKGSAPMVELDTKGARVLSVTRRPKSIDPLVVLYSLYLMANVADRTSFTLSQMMTADFDSPYISPLVAFGMSVEELKAQCVGIASVYPQFLSCTFSLGLDEIKVFPKEKTLDDVLSLILGE